MSVKPFVYRYPTVLTNSVNLILASCALAFNDAPARRSAMAREGATYLTFLTLFTGAVLVHGRHTVTRLIVAAGVRAAHHARFHRFFSRARWEMDDLWERLVTRIVDRLLRDDERIFLAIDETAQRKTGAKIYGAGMVYDNRPKSRKGRDLEWGLTWVVMAVLIRVPIWDGQVFAIPILMRLYRPKKWCRKGGRGFQTKTMLALEMVERLVSWLPGRRFLLLVDGNYADGKLMQALPERVDVVGRLRYDAALYGLSPKARNRIGRPRLHGRRLARPQERVARRANDWTPVTLPNGRTYEAQAWVALWWKVFRQRPIRAVATRRPNRAKPPQFFYTTDLAISVADVLAAYGARWRIECLFHELKETMGFEDPQCRTERAVERTTAFLTWTAGVVKAAYLAQADRISIGWRPRWWARRRAANAPPSFSEMLAALRRQILTERLFHRSASEADMIKRLEALIESVSHAA